MAVYEFKCRECDVIIEEEHPMAEAPSETECPKCNKMVERYYGPRSGSFILKGQGWPSKNLRNGKPVLVSNKLEEVEADRIKKGLPVGKEKPMSDEEFKKKKKNIENWLDQTK